MTTETESAVFSGSTKTFSVERLHAVASAIATKATLREAAADLGCAESTLRAWRQQRNVRERVGMIRQQLTDEKLARFRARELEVEATLFEIIFDKNAAPTPRIAAIREFREWHAALETSAREADNSARADEDFANFAKS